MSIVLPSSLSIARVKRPKGHSLYDGFYYCPPGEHWVPTGEAMRDRRGAPWCPTHRRRLRTRTWHNRGRTVRREAARVNE